jgi:hypothetical protein
MKTSVSDAAWLAAMIDGEGCIEPKYRRITVTNTSMLLLNEVQRIVGCGAVYRSSRYKKRHTQCFRWTTRAKADVAKVLRFVLPYLIAKRDKAVLAIERCEVDDRMGNRSNRCSECGRTVLHKLLPKLCKGGVKRNVRSRSRN